MPAPIPQVQFQISSGIGNVQISPSKVVCVYGCSSAGTSLVPTLYQSVPQRVVTDFGYGPGPELTANLVASGITTVYVKVQTDVPGAAGAVTHTGTGTAIMTVTGVPFDAYDIVVTPVSAGTVGVNPEPTFNISFDGGRTNSRTIQMPASGTYDGFAGTTGLTFLFTAGTLVVGDTYELETTGPDWDVADVADALEAFRLVKQEAAIQYLTGPLSAADATTLATEVNSFIARDKFMCLLGETRNANSGETEAQWMTSISNDYATFVNERFSVWASGAVVQSCISGIKFRRTIGWLAAVKCGLTNPGRDLGAVADGALCPFFQNGQGQPVDEIEHDEGLNPGLNAARFATVKSYNGRDGYFVTNANVMSNETSDFDLLQYRRVMDEACRVANIYFTDQLGSSVRLNRKTGKILEKDARALESGCDTAIEAAIINTGDASPRDGYCTVSREDNISTTKTLNVSIGLLPLGYIKVVIAKMQFVNPALGAAA